MSSKPEAPPRRIAATLTTGPVVSTLLRMTASMLIGFIAGAAFNVVDTIYVSRLGTAPLAAMGYTFPVVMTVFGVVMGIGMGTTSVLSRLIGQADGKGRPAGDITCLVLGIVVTVTFVVTGWLTLPKILRILGANEETLPLALSYLRIWLAGMIFLVIPILGNNAIRATGDMLTPSLIMTLDLGLNIVLDPIFIFGFGPIRPMGIRGAAVATVICRAIALVASLFVLRRAKHLLVIERCRWRELLVSWGKILHVGIPASATTILMPIAAGVLTRLISAHGTSRIAAFSAGTRIEHGIVIPILALGASLVPFIGQNWGAGYRHRVRSGIRLAFGASFIWGVICFAALGLFARRLAPLFSRDDAVINSIVLYLRIVPLSMAFRGISFSVYNSLNAIGRSVHSAAATAVRLFGLQVPMALLGSYLGGFRGILIAVVCSEVLASGVTIVWLHWVLRRAPTPATEEREPQESAQRLALDSSRLRR